MATNRNGHNPAHRYVTKSFYLSQWVETMGGNTLSGNVCISNDETNISPVATSSWQLWRIHGDPLVYNQAKQSQDMHTAWPHYSDSRHYYWHYGVVPWNHFLHFWLFVMGSSTKVQKCGPLEISLLLAWTSFLIFSSFSVIWYVLAPSRCLCDVLPLAPP